MPLYEYKCDFCGEQKDKLRPISEASSPLTCSCGEVMRRMYSPPLRIDLPPTGKEMALNALNAQEGFNIPTKLQDRGRVEKAMAKGFNPPKPTIGRGFG